MDKTCERWGCGNTGATQAFSLLGRTVWLHSSCAHALGTALLELLNRGEDGARSDE